MQHIIKPGKLPDNLKALRKIKGLSQRQVAKILWVSPATISHYETGRREIPISMLPKIAEIYDIEIQIVFKEVMPIQN